MPQSYATDVKTCPKCSDTMTKVDVVGAILRASGRTRENSATPPRQYRSPTCFRWSFKCVRRVALWNYTLRSGGHFIPFAPKPGAQSRVTVKHRSSDDSFHVSSIENPPSGGFCLLLNFRFHSLSFSCCPGFRFWPVSQDNIRDRIQPFRHALHAVSLA